MGAIASGGVQVLNAEVIARLDIPDEVIAAVAAREAAELQRRELAYRSGRSAVEIPGRTVVLVDDGLATGSTMRAAVAALRQRQPEEVVVAVPTAPQDRLLVLPSEADTVLSARTPDPFTAVSESYLDFTQTSDEEVRRLLLAPGPG